MNKPKHFILMKYQCNPTLQHTVSEPCMYFCFLFFRLILGLPSLSKMPERVSDYQGQNFHKLRRACLRRGALFKDPLFPATAQSLFFKREPPQGLTWKRPKVSVRWNAELLDNWREDGGDSDHCLSKSVIFITHPQITSVQTTAKLFLKYPPPHWAAVPACYISIRLG